MRRKRIKQIRKVIKPIVGLLCLTIALSLCSCANPDAEKKHIAVIVKATDSDFWQNVKRGVDSAATEYNVSVTFDGPSSEDDYAAQNGIIENAVSGGADAIVLSAIDYENSVTEVDEAARAGVPTIIIDSNVDSSKTKMFIGTDNIEAGRTAGKAATDDFPDGSQINIGLINYYKSTDNGRLREDGFREYIDGIENAKIISSVNVASNAESAAAAAISLLNEKPQINVLVGFNEWMTLGIGEAIKQLNASNRVRGIGFDTNIESIEKLETGEIDTLIVQNPFAIGYLGVKYAAELISGGSIKENIIYTDVTAVTKDNLFDKDIQKLMFRFNQD